MTVTPAGKRLVSDNMVQERRSMKWLRTTYLGGLTLLAFVALVGLIGRIADGHFPTSGYLLIGVWCVPGLYCFVDLLWVKPSLQPPAQGDERPRERNPLTMAITLPLVLLLFLEAGPLWLWYLERYRMFKDRWVRVGLQTCLFLFLVAAFALLALDEGYSSNGTSLPSFVLRLRAWLGW